MNFKFKLSCRLARMKLPALLAGMLVFGCSLSSTSPTIGLITGIDITPGRVSLLPFQTANLTVVVYSSMTDTAALARAQESLRLSTTGGAINSNGLVGGTRYITYSAPSGLGTYLLVVQTANGSPADTARFTVTATPVPVGAVAVTPASVSLAVNDTTRLHATLTDGSGSVLLGRQIEWSSSDPGVAMAFAEGYIRALAAGTATITATSEGQSGTAVVTVTH